MIQRTQSLYLLIVVVLAVVSLFSTIAAFNVNGTEVASFTNFNFSSDVAPYKDLSTSGPFLLAIILIIVALLASVTILSFHKRVLQMRMTIFNMILLVCYMLLFVMYVILYSSHLEEADKNNPVDFQLKLTAIYPLVSLILCFLAFRGIRRDEKLVRSLERIR